MPSTATLTTAKTGPAQTVTSLVIPNNVVRLEILPYPKSICSIQTSDGRIQELDMSATSTFTLTPSTGNLTIAYTN